MEYRKRRRSFPTRRDKNTFPAYLIAGAAFLALVYLVGLSKAGTLLAEKVIAPVIRNGISARQDKSEEAGSSEETPSAAAETEEARLEAQALVCYALQLGAFESEENAKAQAEAQQKIGAAGYIVNDDALYRVLAAGYPTKAERDSVLERLSEEGVDVRAHTLSYAEKTLVIETDAAQRTRLQTALTHARALPDDVYAVCLAFDRDALSVAAGEKALLAATSRAEKALSLLDGVIADAGGEIEALKTYLRDAALLISACKEEDEEARVQFSARLKTLYLTLACAYGGYLLRG